MPAYRRQHFVPCSYLANFASERRVDARTSRIWAFNGRVCLNVPVESQAAEAYLYSRLDPKGAEDYLHGTFEHDYPGIAKKIIGREAITEEERFRLLIFMLSLYARSPDFEVRDGVERVKSLSDIIGSLVNAVEPVRPEDYAEDGDYAPRLLSRFSTAVIRLQERTSIWTSDNPCVPLEDRATGTMAAVVFLPIDPKTIVVYYRNDVFRQRAEPTPAGDFRLFVTQVRDRRIRWVYHHADLSHMCRPDLEFPRASYARQYVDARRVGFSMPVLLKPLSFLEHI